MWMLALLFVFMASDPAGPGDIYISQGPDGYWYLGRHDEGIVAGPYVTQEHAARASRHAGYGELTDDQWWVHYYASPFGTGYWAYRRSGLAGPFDTMNEALDWVREQKGLQGA